MSRKMSQIPQREKILVIQLARFGDFLQTTPLLAALKASRPQSEIWTLVASAQAEVARANPHVDHVLTIDLHRLENIARIPDLLIGERVVRFSEELAFLKTLSFDSILNLNTSRVAGLLAELPGARRHRGPRLAEDRVRLLTAPWAVFIMNMLTHRRLIRFNLVDLLACYADLDARAGDSLIYPVPETGRQAASELISDMECGPLVGFQVGSRHKTRQWPPDYFADLARRLIETHNARIVLLGVESEKAIGREVMDSLETISPSAANRVVDLMGRTTIPELAGVLSRLDLLVTTDTGTMHLAAAVRRPILALFMGPAFCHETGPYGAGHIILQAVEPCSPCLEGHPTCRDFPCRTRITPESAFRAAGQLLFPEIKGFESVQTDEANLWSLISDLDEFGVIYRHQRPRALDREELLAIAYRETGRLYMRPTYRLDPARLHRECAIYHSAPKSSVTRDVLKDLSLIRRDLAEARRGIKTWDNGSHLPPDLLPLLGTVRAVVQAGESKAAARLLDNMEHVLPLVAAPMTLLQNKLVERNSTIVQSSSNSL